MAADSAGESSVKMSPQESVKKALSILSSLAQAPSSSPAPQESTNTKRASLGAQCQPWSKQDFYQRLKSFSAANWFDKPAQISATECARHGWTNEGPDRLRCDSCKRKLTMAIHSSLKQEAKEKVVQRFEEQMQSSGHSSLCPWKDNPVPLSLLQLPGSSTHEVMGAFRSRLRTLTRCRVLPEIDPDFIQGADVQQVVEACGWSRRKLDPGVLLAACGWQAQRLGGDSLCESGEMAEEGEAMLVCEEDQRSAGLWNFRTAPYRPGPSLFPDRQPEPASSLGKRSHPQPEPTVPQVMDGGGEGAGAAAEAGEEEGGGDIFSNPSKRARVMAGALPSASFGFEPTASATFGLAAFTASKNASWGLLSPQVERISLGHSWAQQPLGALVEPAPSVDKISRRVASFHPLRQHRTASAWTASSLPLLNLGSLPSASLRTAPAWQQTLAIVLQSLPATSAAARLVALSRPPEPAPDKAAEAAASSASEREDAARRNEELVSTAQSNLRRWIS